MADWPTGEWAPGFLLAVPGRQREDIRFRVVVERDTAFFELDRQVDFPGPATIARVVLCDAGRRVLFVIPVTFSPRAGEVLSICHGDGLSSAGSVSGESKEGRG